MPLTQNLKKAFAYLDDIIDRRLTNHHSPDEPTICSSDFPSFELTESDDYFTQFVAGTQPTIEEFILLLLALAPHLDPTFLERKVLEYLPDGGEFPLFGGAKATNSRFVTPTVATGLFILAGNDMSERLRLLDLFDEHDNFLFERKILSRQASPGNGLIYNDHLLMDPEFVELFLQGRMSVPTFGNRFPAELLNTGMEWEDLVLNAATAKQLKQIEIWLNHHETLMDDWGMGKRISPGYRALFHGPPGTGKTLAATLVAKYTDTPIFRIDLSKVVSKYIGETEKNLSALFDKAEHKGWCLFFDEADACFGKRSSTKDSKDRYANQEVSYLLQRIEKYAGLVIMATNFKDNIDNAFLRRVQSVIHFPAPNEAERLRLWQRAFPDKISLEPGLELSQLARSYELTGSGIMNAVQFACLQALQKGTTEITLKDIADGVKRELMKEGRRG